jgi:hypothetical protein
LSVAALARSVDWLDFRDRAVFLPGSDVLVLADTHVGRAEASDVTVPLGEAADLDDRLGALLDACDPREVVVAGDVLHRFDRASHGVRESLTSLTDACRDAGARPVLVAGNHDTVLDAVWDGPCHDEYRLADAVPADAGGGDVLVCHGHEVPESSAALYVVGHDHPTVDIEGRRRPCFLYGAGVYRGGDVLMLPAFTRLAAGVEINDMRGSDFQSPLVADADAFRPVVYDPDRGASLTFPELGRFRRLL